MRWIAVTLLCCRSAYGAEQGNELFLFQPVSSQVATVHIDVGHRATRPVSRLLYGKFAEHLGRNIYRGMLAQLLVNSGFESKEVWGQRAERIGTELAWRLNTPALADAAKEGLPPGWIALSHQNAPCRPVPNSRTGRQSLRLEATDPDASVGV